MQNKNDIKIIAFYTYRPTNFKRVYTINVYNLNSCASLRTTYDEPRAKLSSVFIEKLNKFNLL